MRNRPSLHLQDYVQQGFSLIPLVGGDDMLAGKKPAVAWKNYQAQLPTPVELTQWFDRDGYEAYGIICGLLSGLVVLDFDDVAAFTRFSSHFSHLLNTQIVRSRRGFHVYFRVNFPVNSRAFLGGELKGEGGYVVGPGSKIGGYTWTILQKSEILTISEQNLAEILNFLAPSKNPLETTPLPPLEMLYTPAEAAQLYQANVKREAGQRNRALFQTACYLRDMGYQEAWTFEALAEAHAHQSALPHHPGESPAQRYQEARATIASAYRRPPRLPLHHRASCVPNSIREALLQLPDGVLALRLLEGLALAGVKTPFNMQEATARLKKYLAPKTIARALKVTTLDGLPIFEKNGLISTLSTNCPTETNAVFSMPSGRWMSAAQGDERPERRGDYRPAQSYRIPEITELCALLNVKLTPADPIYWEDVQSSAAYRAALNRNLIRRRKGRYIQAWLAHRLKVSDRTIRRYLKADPHLHAAPTCVAVEVDDQNIGRLPYADEWTQGEMGGCFLITAKNKRYPAKREIAQRYLRAGQRIWYAEQGPNFYWYDANPKAVPPSESLPNGYKLAENGLKSEHGKNRQSKNEKYYPRMDKFNSIEPLQNPLSNSQNKPIEPPENSPSPPLEDLMLYVKDITPPPEKRLEKRRQVSSRRQYQYPLPDSSHEETAEEVYRTINQIAPENKRMSIANARRLVADFGPSIVRKQLKYVVDLHQRGKIHNPAGILVCNVESAWMHYHQWTPFNASGFPEPRRQFSAQPKRPSRQEKQLPPAPPPPPPPMPSLQPSPEELAQQALDQLGKAWHNYTMELWGLRPTTSEWHHFTLELLARACRDYIELGNSVEDLTFHFSEWGRL